MDMATINRFYRVVAGAAVVAAATTLGPCSLDKQEMPALSGPSGLAVSLSMAATPDHIPRDGSSQSIVTITARDPQGTPIVGLHVSLALGSNAPQGASVSQSEVVTGSA